MKKNYFLLSTLFLLLAAGSLRGQLVVPSYERAQPFYFCSDSPLGEPLSVPFDFVNTGQTELLIDSAIAVGDTADFYANGLPGGDHSLNPVMWKYLNGRTLPGGTTLFNNFFFAPKSPGPKQIVVTVYYHEGAVAKSTQTTIRFNTATVSAGPAFLALKTDTVLYGDPAPYRVITHDRVVISDTLFIVDTLAINDTLRPEGEGAIHLVSCGPTTITSIETLSDAVDPFVVLLPTLPLALDTGDSALVDFVFVPRTAPMTQSTTVVKFITSDEQELVLHVTVIPRFTGAVGTGDERGGSALARLRSMPNPFNGSTTFRLDMARPEHARLTVLNVLGEQVALLHDAPVEAGEHILHFNAAGLPAGIYFARLEAGKEVVMERLVLEQ